MCRQADEIQKLGELVSQLTKSKSKDKFQDVETHRTINTDKLSELREDIENFKTMITSELADIKENMTKMTLVINDLQVTIDSDIAKQLESQNKALEEKMSNVERNISENNTLFSSMVKNSRNKNS